MTTYIVARHGQAVKNSRTHSGWSYTAPRTVVIVEVPSGKDVSQASRDYQASIPFKEGGTPRWEKLMATTNRATAERAAELVRALDRPADLAVVTRAAGVPLDALARKTVPHAALDRLRKAKSNAARVALDHLESYDDDEGFGRSGFDREGFDRRGLNTAGQLRDHPRLPAAVALELLRQADGLDLPLGLVAPAVEGLWRELAEAAGIDTAGVAA